MNTTYYFSGMETMKESVKLNKAIVTRVRKRIKVTKQTIGGFFEVAAEDALA